MRIFLIAALMLMSWLSVSAVVAHPQPQVMTQPDGTQVTLRLIGDEFSHRYETMDGYTVMRDATNRWVYAQLLGQNLVPTTVMAHDVAQRGNDEAMAASLIARHTFGVTQQRVGRSMRARRDEAMLHAPVIDYSKFRGLIILINYNDCGFLRDDVHEFYDAMVNQDNYGGYQDGSQWVECPGSVRDYFRDNSNDMFCPQFDVVGPVTVPFSCRHPESTQHADDIFSAALDSVDAQVDFTRYDADGDGVVDMVFFLVAGYSANFTGNDEGYLWPHMYYLDETPRDGMRFNRYACSTEIYGWEAQGSTIPMGISVICHEFTHVMGFPDLYDTDGAGSGGESHHPGDWDVMASGTFFNYGRNPVSYSIFERYAFGFATPTVIGNTGHYVLPCTSTDNCGFILRTSNPDEYFMMENRQPVKWDAYLPGHGMIVARVDSSDATAWMRHRVNVNPEHNYYELLRAGGSVAGTQPSDPFPGSNHVTRIDNVTSANLLTWDFTPHQWVLDHIAEANSVVEFDVVQGDGMLQLVEDFESMPVTTELNVKNVAGQFTNWDFIRACVVPSKNHGNGEHVMSVSCPGAVTTAQPMNDMPFMVSCRVDNSTSSAVKISFTYSIDEKQSWHEVSPENVAVGAYSTATVRFRVHGISQPAYYRFSQTGGSSTNSIYIDDLTFSYLLTEQPLVGDVNGDGRVDVVDINLIVNAMLGIEDDSEVLSHADVTGDGQIDVTDINAVINAMLGGARLFHLKSNHRYGVVTG